MVEKIIKMLCTYCAWAAYEAGEDRKMMTEIGQVHSNHHHHISILGIVYAMIFFSSS